MIRVLVIFLILNFILSCSSGIQDSSEFGDFSSIKQVTYKTFRCDVDGKRAQMILDKYSKHFIGDSNLKSSAAKVLSKVPQAYLSYVLEKYKIPIYLYYNYGGGVTYLHFYYYQGRLVAYPELIKSIIQVLLHEFGHASMGVDQLRKADFNQKLLELARLTLYKYNTLTSRYLQTYQQIDEYRRDELYAELFSTWYCSDGAREELKRTMPEVYQFAFNYLLPPLDLNNKDNFFLYTKYPVKLIHSSLDSNNDSYYLLIKVNEDIKSAFDLMYCIGDKKSCLRDSSLHIKARLIDKSKKIFITVSPLNLSLSSIPKMWIFIKTSEKSLLKRGISFTLKN